MTYYRLFYHFVWTTKERLPLITEGNEAAIYATIRAKARQLNVIVYALMECPITFVWSRLYRRV